MYVSSIPSSYRLNSSRPMSASSSLLIEENSEELELAMQAASRQPLQQIATNVCTPPAGAPEAAAEQVCSARE